MLVLTRKTDEWVEITYRPTGETFRVGVGDIRSQNPVTVKLLFDDDSGEFRFHRLDQCGERAVRGRRLRHDEEDE